MRKLAMLIGVAALGSVATVVASAPAWAFSATLTEREATTVMFTAIRRQARHAVPVGTRCRVSDNLNRALCDSAWRSGGRSWIGHARIWRRDTATHEIIHFVLRARSVGGGKPRTTRKDGTVWIAIPPGATPGNPVPRGSAARVGRWRISVLSADMNATARVLAESDGNKGPGLGEQYVVARLSAVYLGGGSSSFGLDNDPSVTGRSKVPYTTYRDSCGDIPDEIAEYADVLQGGTVIGNVCWTVQSTDADFLVMAVGDLESGAVYFALNT